MSLQRRPMSALYDAVRRYLEHGQDDYIGRDDFDYHTGLYESPPHQPVAQSQGQSQGWRPHPLNFHPTNTPESRDLAQKIIKGTAELLGHKVHIEPTRHSYVETVVSNMAEELQLDHVYCLFLLRAVGAEDMRLWVENKVRPAGIQTEDAMRMPAGVGIVQNTAVVPGMGVTDMVVPLRDDVLGSAKYLFFIEKRAALNAMLELVQGRMSDELKESKRHAVGVVVDRLIKQGLPVILMRRIESLTRDNKCRGATPLQVEYAVERQKAAHCLFFLYYQTPILPEELLPLSTTATPSLSARDGFAAAGAAGGQSVTLLGLVKFLTDELRRRAGVAADEDQKKKEERALYRTLTTVLMTLISALVTLTGYTSRSDRPAGDGSLLLAWISEAADAVLQKKQEYEHVRRVNNQRPNPSADRELKAIEAEIKARKAALKERVDTIDQALRTGWPNKSIEAVVLLAWGAFLRDPTLVHNLHASLGMNVHDKRRDILGKTMAAGVFTFIEGALVSCWRRQIAPDILPLFFVDVTVEMLHAYLNDTHMHFAQGHQGLGTAARASTPTTFDMFPGALQPSDAGALTLRELAELRRANIEALVSLIIRISEIETALSDRLLWSGEKETHFVGEVTSVIRQRTDLSLLPAWMHLLATMVAGPDPEKKLQVLDLVADGSPFEPEVLSALLTDARERCERHQPLNRDFLLPALLIIERVTCREVLADQENGWLHQLPKLGELLSYRLDADVKGAVFRAMAPFAVQPEIARQMWEHLESLSILPRKDPVTGTWYKEKLLKELDEVESVQQVYPLTEGYATLIVELIKGDIPYDLGEQTGRPNDTGIHPYVEYLIDEVLLNTTRMYNDHGQQWRIVTKILEAVVLILERYPLGDPNDDRLRHLSLDPMQRKLARSEMQKDFEYPMGRGPSPGFTMLLRLLAKDVRPVSTQMPEFRSMVLQIVAGYSERDREALGPERLEREARTREHRAWAEALQVFDGEVRSPRWTVPADEVMWHEEAVNTAVSLLNNVLTKDLELQRTYRALVAEGGNHEYFQSVTHTVALHECISPLPLERGRARQEQLLPIMIAYTAYELHSSLRLHAALFLRAILDRFKSPTDVERLFPSAEDDYMRQECTDAVIKTISEAGMPVEDYALEFCDLRQALNLVSRIKLDPGKVARLVHYLILDMLLKNLVPFRATISHRLLGFREEQDQLSLPPPAEGGQCPLHLIVKNLLAPSFLLQAPMLAERSMELVFRLCIGSKSTHATLAYLQRDEVDFFRREFRLLRTEPMRHAGRPPPTLSRLSSDSMRPYVRYSSQLHLWAWLLKAIAVALHKQRFGGGGGAGELPQDHSKIRGIFDLLFSEPQPDDSMQTSIEPGHEFERRGYALVDLLTHIPLAQLDDYPKCKPELQPIAEGCSQPLPGPPELQKFRAISTELFADALKERMSAYAAYQGQDGEAAVSLQQSMMRQALQYANHWNHFVLRVAGEWHFCEAWRMVTETTLTSCEELVLKLARRPEEELSAVLTVLSHCVQKLKVYHNSDLSVSEQISAVVLAAVGVLYRYGINRGEGIPVQALSLDAGKRTLDMLLMALTIVGSSEATGHSKFRRNLYAAFVLFVRVTTLPPLFLEPQPLALPDQPNGASADATIAQLAPVGKQLLRSRRESNASVVVEYLPMVVKMLVQDCAFERTNSTAKVRNQSIAASCLSVVIETLLAGGLDVDQTTRRSVTFIDQMAPRVGQYDAAVEQVVQELPRVLRDLEPQFCIQARSDRSALLGDDRPWDGVFVYYVSMLTQLAQSTNAAMVMLRHGVVENVSRSRFLLQLEDHNMPSLDREQRMHLLTRLGAVMRFLQVMLTTLRGEELLAKVAQFCQDHYSTISQFMEVRQSTLDGLNEVAAVVGVLSHIVKYPRALSIPETEEYRRIVNDLFEKFAVEMLPPHSVRFSGRGHNWWESVEDLNDNAVPCGPPPGAHTSYSWRVSDSGKLVVSQTLLLHVTTYIRRRVSHAAYPNIAVETVLKSLRNALDLLASQGEGPAAPIPSLAEVERANNVGLKKPQGRRMWWDYGFLRTSLRQLADNLLYILYHLILTRLDTQPPALDLRYVRREFALLLEHHWEWFERTSQSPQTLYLRSTRDGIMDLLKL